MTSNQCPAIKEPPVSLAVIGAFCSLGLTCGVSGQSPVRILELRPLSGDAATFLAAMSGDGSTAVGRSGDSPTHATRWPIGAGDAAFADALAFELPAGTTRSFAQAAVSRDGSVAFLDCFVGHAESLVRWQAGSLSTVPYDSWRGAFFQSCSADASSAAGIVLNGNVPLALAWTAQRGFQRLHTSYYRNAAAMSADGMVVVGSMWPAPPDRALRWTRAGDDWTLEELPPPAGGASCDAWGLSADGRVAVGNAYRSGGPSSPAAIWISGAAPDGGTRLVLVPAPGAGSFTLVAADATGASAGGYLGGPNESAAYWRENMGAVELAPYLVSLGADATGWIFNRVTAVSEDGTALAGNGKLDGLARGFVVRGLPRICRADLAPDGFLDFFDYDEFVRRFELGTVEDGGDFNLDGSVDFFDFDDFIAAFEAGC